MTAGAGSEVVPHQRLQILDPRYRVSVAGWGRGEVILDTVEV